MSWEDIGPEGYGVSMVAVAPSCPDTILVEPSEDNYLMRTTDGGATWEGVLDVTHDISALTFDPSDPMIAYCVSRGAVHKSVDAGESWTALTERIGAQSVAVDP
ncbi:hypothetical protein KAW64_16885, partial [bacterium]|nr:hypothetical protein [bacterium]